MNTVSVMTPERLEEIGRLRDEWRLCEVGTVPFRRVDPFIEAMAELLMEVRRVRGVNPE